MTDKAPAAAGAAIPAASFTPTEAADRAPAGEPSKRPRPPMYWRLLRLHHARPNGWQRALFIEGSLVVAALLALAGLASVWTLLALPAVVAVMVKAHDVLLGALAGPEPQPGQGLHPDGDA